MAVIYLKHPVHGAKVACSEFEADGDKANGWEVFDPTVPAPKASKPAEEPPVAPPAPPADIPAFLTPAPAPKSKGGRPPKVK